MRVGFDCSPLFRPFPPGLVRVCERSMAALEQAGDLDVVRLEPPAGVELSSWRHKALAQAVQEKSLAGVHSFVSAFPFRGPGLKVQTLHELPWKHGVAENAGWRHKLWARFGQPDYAMAFHVSSEMPTGKLGVTKDSPYSGADTVDIIVHGVGAHGASPHRGVDPVVLGSQIVLALQTVVSRELAPREAGVITVGSFHSGTKHNIISDKAHLQLTVRNDNHETRELLLAGIKRVAENMGRVAGLPEDKLPEVIVSDESVPPTINENTLTQRLRGVWKQELGEDIFYEAKREGMGAEDFPYFTTDPYIASTYFAVGGTPQADFDAEAAGGPAVPSHHSPLFKVKAEESVTLGVEATVIALRDLLQVIAR